MKGFFQLLGILTCAVFYVHGGVVHLAIEKCCRLGDEWASRSSNCDGTSNRFKDVAEQDQDLCLWSFKICCLRSQRNSLCQTGKETAKKNGECAVLPAVGGETHKDCCDGCKLGIKAAERNEACFFQGFSLSAPWDEAFYSCCSSHKAAPEPNFPEFPLEPANNRCLSNNPCSQTCQDVGGPSVKCGCNAGYKLESNGFGCSDVDECAERIHSCDLRTESCLNSDGGYHCIENEGVGGGPPRENSVDYFDGGRLIPKKALTSDTRCPAGLIYNATRRECTDVDECATGIANCVRGSQDCTNTMGSFTCVDKNPSIKQCPPGFKFHPTKQCDDIDECQEGLSQCDPIREVCINSYGDYSCQVRGSRSCPAGYKFNDARDSCDDVDECSENLYSCSEDTEECVNTAGGYSCNPICGDGFVFDTLQKECVDFDECSDNPQVCARGESCINTLGSFQCVPEANHQGTTCPAGFKADARGNCQDVDECKEGLHSCRKDAGEVCINSVGTFDCLPMPTSKLNDNNQICSNGLKFDSYGRKCIDIDECQDSTLNNCNPATEVCQNTVGSYRCIPKDSEEPSRNAACPRGYRRDPYSRRCEDLNECQLGVHTCESSQRCDNTVGSFFCVRVTDCGTGYTLNAQTGRCEDNDECTLNPNTCSRDFICRNTEGSFRCDRITCPEGERLLRDGICHPINCAPGMELDAQGRCSDVNECLSPNLCRQNQRCINTPGSYRCQSAIICGGGFEPNTYGTDCVDIDECQQGTHECTANQICKNRPGGYACECPVGYLLNAKRVCEDVDECTRHRGICSINSECQNTLGSYVCHCKTGFRNPANSQSCEDVDECHESANLCQHNCINTWGSFQCTCKPGFILAEDKRSCQDVDECELYKDKGNLCIGFCVNNPGSYGCSCPDGYRLGGDTRTCQDINECLEDGVCSGEHQTCLNTRGGYKCFNVTCPPNYVKDITHKKGGKSSKTCRKKCVLTDTQCILNTTQTISYQGISFPSIPVVTRPLVVSKLHLAAPSSASYTNFQDKYTIIDGNHDGYFELVKNNGEGVLNLLKPIQGPLDINLKLLMEARFQNRLTQKQKLRRVLDQVSTHLVHLNVVVSPYTF